MELIYVLSGEMGVNISMSVLSYVNCVEFVLIILYWSCVNDHLSVLGVIE